MENNKSDTSASKSYSDGMELAYKWVYENIELKKEFEHFDKDQIQKITHKMSLYGWYADDFSLQSKINFKDCLRFIYSGFPEKMDNHLSKYYTDKLVEIEENLKNEYPKRKSIIYEAFFAHKKGLYHASTCLFITLIDGICDETFYKKFFMNQKDHLPQIKGPLKTKGYSAVDFIITPIIKKGALNGYKDDLKSYPVRLNRHEIIHGVDVSYGTEINSLKTLSLLTYIDYVLTIYKSDYKKPIPLLNKNMYPKNL